MIDSQHHITKNLVKRAREGDTTAFSELMKMYKDVSLSLAASIIKDQAKAEDVLQDAFMKVYHNLKGFKQKSSFATWLYRIVVNTAYTALQKEQRYNEAAEIEEILESDFDDQLMDHLKEEEQKHFINLALQKISADEALSLRLFYLCELQISEIEEITGHSRPKIKVDLHRGRGNLLFQLQRLLGKELKNLL